MIDYQDYKEKILMSLTGKSIGGILGAKTENQKQWHEIADIEREWPEKPPANDDLDIQILWLEALQEYGPHLTAVQMSGFWQRYCFYYFCEYGTFLYNIQRGIMPPVSGKFGNEFFEESNGCPIRAEIWGLVAPGFPDIAAGLAKQDAGLDHDENGTSSHLEQFWAAASSLAFSCSDRETVLGAAAEYLPSGSPARDAWEKVPVWCADFSLSEKQVWRRIIRHYGSSDASKAITNFAICLLAIYRGGDDLKNVMTLCLNSGWDVDCTAATCAAFLCLLKGRSIFPPDWMEKAGKNLLCAIAVRHKQALLEDVAEDIAVCGIEMLKSRHPDFYMKNMPDIKVRPVQSPSVSIQIRYHGEPVLHRMKPTTVSFFLRNNTENAKTLKVRITGPDSCRIVPDCKRILLPAKGSSIVQTEISFRNPEYPLPDKNLFKIECGDSALSFGLGGIRTWKIYGPYWDMWDTVKYPECPFHNGKVDCMPGALPGFMGDSYVQYVRLDKEYLDETALIGGADLPEEDPFCHEASTDRLDLRNLFGFTGAACFYLVRDILYEGEAVCSRFSVGRDGPFRYWFDGTEIASRENVISWSQHSDSGFTRDVKFTGKRQRIVVKLLRFNNELIFSTSPMQAPDSVRGVSWFSDRMSDLV